MLITALCTIYINTPASAYDGYYIPCSDGGSGNCVCDVDKCGSEWNDTLRTFMCGNTLSCNCLDVSYGTITFACGCYSDSDCGSTSEYGCINNRCAKCKSCSGASTGTWTPHSTGYQKRTVTTCNCNGTLTTHTEYRCDTGYYGTTSNGTSGCTRCPSSGDIYGSSVASSISITKCYLPSGTGFSNSTGSGTYTDNCYYTN